MKQTLVATPSNLSLPGGQCRAVRFPAYKQCSGRAIDARAQARNAADATAQALGRRELIQIGLCLSLVGARPAFAEPEVADVFAEAPAIEAAAGVGLAAQPWLDEDFQLTPPATFTYVETDEPFDPNRRGPAPERSPVRARFDSPDHRTVVSVVLRSASTLKQSILQINDVSAFGSPEEAAKLLLPRGSKVLSLNTFTVALPARQTALGPVEVPPKNYYRYEVVTPNGLHLYMNVAAQKGKVYVCGASSSAAEWGRLAPVLRATAETFRLRDGKMVM